MHTEDQVKVKRTLHFSIFKNMSISFILYFAFLLFSMLKRNGCHFDWD